MSSPIPAADRRTIRTYARREDAEQARAALADHNIEGKVEEFLIVRPGSATKVPAGCQLSVPSVDAANAARVLLKMPPTDTAGTPGIAVPASPSRLRRRVGPAPRQRNPAMMILIAVLCSAAAMFWLVNSFMHRKPAPVVTEADDPENYVISEDINHDSEPDIWREYTPASNGPGKLLSMLEDRDFDGRPELRWVWQRGLLMYRDRDIDGDGVMDERTTFDGADQPFYVDLRLKGRGPVIRRRVYREGVLWKILEDQDADTRFDRIKEFSVDGTLFRDEPLPPDSTENSVPKPESLPATEDTAAAVKLQSTAK